MTGNSRIRKNNFFFIDWIRQKFSVGSNKKFAGATLDTDQFSYEFFRNGKPGKQNQNQTSKSDSKQLEKNLKLRQQSSLTSHSKLDPLANEVIRKTCGSNTDVEDISNDDKRGTLTRFKNKLRSSFAGISSLRKRSTELRKGRFSDVGILEENLFPVKESHPTRLFSLKSSSSSASPSISLSALSSSSSISTISSSNSYFPNDSNNDSDNTNTNNQSNGNSNDWNIIQGRVGNNVREGKEDNNIKSLIGVEINEVGNDNLLINKVKASIYDNLHCDVKPPQLNVNHQWLPIAAADNKIEKKSDNLRNQSDGNKFNMRDASSDYVFCNTNESFSQQSTATNIVDSSESLQIFTTSLVPIIPRQNCFKNRENNRIDNIEDNYCLRFDSDHPNPPPKTYKRTYSDHHITKMKNQTPSRTRQFNSLTHPLPDCPVRDFSNLSKSVALKCELFCQKVDEMSKGGYIPMKVQSFNGRT